MAQFHSITREEMASYLEGQGFRPMIRPNVTELLWGKRVDLGGQALSVLGFQSSNVCFQACSRPSSVVYS